jgi:hypothetical protein
MRQTITDTVNGYCLFRAADHDGNGNYQIFATQNYESKGERVFFDVRKLLGPGGYKIEAKSQTYLFAEKKGDS